MENTTYEAPELIELGILNVDTLAQSHGGGKKKKKKGGKPRNLTEARRKDMGDDEPYCKPRKGDDWDEDPYWCLPK